MRRFFVAEEGGYRIAKAVRERCVFSRQNIVRDPPFSHLDLISCRNVLIYLDTPLQRRVFPIFHYALEPHGLLMLGTAESTGVASDLFVPLAKRYKIFRRVAAPVQPLDIDFTVPAASARGSAPATLPWRRPLPFPLPDASSRDDVASGGDRVLLARFVPPGVIVDEQREILHFRGDTSAFLTHAPGVASLDLLALARPELVMPLRSALSRATASGEPVSEDRVVFVDGGARREVTVEVIPFRPASSALQCFVVTFMESPRTSEGVDAPRKVARSTSSRRTMRRSESDADSAPELARAREELSATRRYLQDVIEQHNATIEELRAASEEIQSSNEELQSTNEELETTKEEVQSANEELTTLNDELLHRNRELAALSADLSNVLSSTTIPIAIVDSDLRLRRFTPALARVMRVIPTDAGRPLGDIRLRFSLPDLDQIIARTIETLTVIEHDVQDEDGFWWTMTVRPYQTLDRHVDGAVLVFGDIDTAKRAGDRSEKTSAERGRLLAVSEAARDTAERARERAEQANEAKATFLASMSHDLRTPLNAITGYVNLLELGVRGAVNESQLTDLARIKGNARHLLAIINDILNFARVEAGQLDLRPTVLSLPALLDEVESLVAPQLALKGVHFERGEAHGAAYADAERVQQVLVNLLTNAIKFTPAAGRITVTGAVDEDRAEITVSDTGVGIPLDELERIFEPFVQVGRGLTTPPPDGVGLGLAISRDLARAMHGDLTVTSVVGEGSTFVLTLPRA